MYDLKNVKRLLGVSCFVAFLPLGAVAQSVDSGYSGRNLLQSSAGERGFYMGIEPIATSTSVELTEDTTVHVDGLGAAVLLGWRLNESMRLEFTHHALEYGDIEQSGVRFNDPETGETRDLDGVQLTHTADGSFNAVSFMYQRHYGRWQPFARVGVAYSEVVLDARQYTNHSDSAKRSFGSVVGIGTDFALIGGLSLRTDITYVPDGRVGFGIGTLWHF